MRIAACYGSGNEIRARILALQNDAEVGFGFFIAVGHDPFAYDDLCRRTEYGARRSGSIVHAAELNRIHRQNRSFGKLRVRDRIDPFDPFSASGSDVFFQIQNPCVLCKDKPVNAVMAGLSVVFGMHAASCNDGDVGVFSNIKIVVYEIINRAVRHAGRNVHFFVFCTGRNADDKPRSVLLGFYFDVFGRFASCALSIFTDIVCAALYIDQIF